jgi:hypothetical protein
MQAALKVRRARRDDFARVQALLGATAATRADRKRFRRLVSTMREDLYLVEQDGDDALAGLAVIVYTRGLGARTAIVRTLHGTRDAMLLLLDCARDHAAARGCTQLEVDLQPNVGAAGELIATVLAAAPWSDGPRVFRRTIVA